MDSQRRVFDLTPLDLLTPLGYIRQIYCFPAGTGAVQTLKKGLAGLLEDVPYLGSGIVKTGDPAAPVRLSDPYESVDDLFAWLDLSESVDYASFKAVNFSPRSLTRKDIEPELPEQQLESVFRAKLTLLNGGCLLYVCLHHSGSDITAFGTLMKLWAAHCRDGSSERVGFSLAWLDRTPLSRLGSKALKPPPERPVPTSDSSQPNTNAVEEKVFETAIFRFPSKPLQDLKAQANTRVPSIGVPWVSTSDILIALLWSAATEAEAKALEESTFQKPTVTIVMPVNFRHRLNPPLPKEYLGAAYSATAATALRDDLLSVADSVDINSLTTIAAAVRSSYGKVTHDSVSETAGLIQACPDLSKVKWGPSHDGLVFVSWADQGIYELDWGHVIGKCEAVRFQEFGFKAYPYILPRLPSQNGDAAGGDFEFILSLEEKAMESFKEGFVMSEIAAAAI